MDCLDGVLDPLHTINIANQMLQSYLVNPVSAIVLVVGHDGSVVFSVRAHPLYRLGLRPAFGRNAHEGFRSPPTCRELIVQRLWCQARYGPLDARSHVSRFDECTA